LLQWSGLFQKNFQSMSKLNSGAQYEIAIDGTPRTHRDLKELAIKAATFSKTKNPNAEVTVRDLKTGEVMMSVKHLNERATVTPMAGSPKRKR